MIKAIFLLLIIFFSSVKASDADKGPGNIDFDFDATLDVIFENLDAAAEVKGQNESDISIKMDICQESKPAATMESNSCSTTLSINTDVFMVKKISELRDIMLLLKPRLPPQVLELFKFEYDLGALIDDCKTMQDIRLFMKHVLDNK